MRRIGVRELRQRASEVLRAVERGSVYEVTDRGRPVALIAPLPDVGPMERLRIEGEVAPATGSVDDLPAPLPLVRGRISPSAALARLRKHER